MATLPPMPISYSSGHIAGASSTRLQIRHTTTLCALTQSQGLTSNIETLQSTPAGDSSDEEMPQMPKLSVLAQAMLGQHGDHLHMQSHDHNPSHCNDVGGVFEHALSPQRRTHAPNRASQARIRISRDTTPKHDSITPAPSVRVKRTALQGAPMRCNRRTPQGDEEQSSPSPDQENIPVSIVKPEYGRHILLIHRDDSGMKAGNVKSDAPAPREEAAVPLVQVSVNMPMRPAPPPPPPTKPSDLDTATTVRAASGKQKKRRVAFNVNGKSYQQLDRLGKGGSGPVYRVMSQEGALWALKRVKLDTADETAVLGFRGEIDLLKKLKNESRVVDLHDWQIDEERKVLSVVLEMGDADLAYLLKSTKEGELPSLDIPFIHYYWEEMLKCVAVVHAHDIVHTDLKPANFIIVKGKLKLIDFGIAGAIDVEHTVNMHRDNHVGTSNYMSPESLQDSNADAKRAGIDTSNDGRVSSPITKLVRVGKPSDVWSLGCILYQMTYGQPPFAYIENYLHRAFAIIDEKVEILYPSTGFGGSDVPAALKRILKACLARNPADRPTVSALLANDNEWLYPESSADVVISEDTLALVIKTVAESFWESSTKGVPTEADVQSYSRRFWERLKERQTAA